MGSAPGRRRSSQPVIPGEYQHHAMLHGPRLQRFWHRHKLSVMSQVLPVASHDVVLDVGCGSGNLTFHVGAVSRLAIGLDPSQGAARYCHGRSADPRCAFAVAEGEALPLADRSVDAVLLVEVVEHLERPEAVLHEAHRVLKVGGRLLVTTPNYGPGSPWPLIEWVVDHSGLVPRMGGAQHVRTYGPEELVKALNGSGFSVERQGTFYRWSPLVALLSPRRAASLVAREVDGVRLDGALIYSVARA